jgi:hypothetical protein
VYHTFCDLAFPILAGGHGIENMTGHPSAIVFALSGVILIGLAFNIPVLRKRYASWNARRKGGHRNQFCPK